MVVWMRKPGQPTSNTDLAACGGAPSAHRTLSRPIVAPHLILARRKDRTLAAKQRFTVALNARGDDARPRSAGRLVQHGPHHGDRAPPWSRAAVQATTPCQFCTSSILSMLLPHGGWLPRDRAGVAAVARMGRRELERAAHSHRIANPP